MNIGCFVCVCVCEEEKNEIPKYPLGIVVSVVVLRFPARVEALVWRGQPAASEHKVKLYFFHTDMDDFTFTTICWTYELPIASYKYCFFHLNEFSTRIKQLQPLIPLGSISVCLKIGCLKPDRDERGRGRESQVEKNVWTLQLLNGHKLGTHPIPNPSEGWQLDLAVGSSLVTKTFTGSYGKLAYGAEGLSMAGPLLLDAEGKAPRWLDSTRGFSCQTFTWLQTSYMTGDLNQSKEPQIIPAETWNLRTRFAFPKPEQWKHVRYFSPKEMANLMGFPDDWSLPGAGAMMKCLIFIMHLM